MKYLFRTKKLGWDEEREGVWFDSEMYTREEAEAQFVPYEGRTYDGYPYTGYEFEGEKLYSYDYIGEFESVDDMPKNDDEYVDYLLNRRRGGSE